MTQLITCAAPLLILCSAALADVETVTPPSTVVLQRLSANVLSVTQRKDAARMIDRDIRRRSDEANARSRDEWSRISDRQAWHAYRDDRLKKLWTSLGQFPSPPRRLRVEVTGSVKGDGFRIENLVYESRPDQWVTGNLYVPAPPTDSMPGILIAHAHHRPKTQGELQDMGMTWARAGCQVLVIDQVGFGERRGHPFHQASDYEKPFPVSRQDYYFRYDSGIQLQLAGDSLMGWMVWDLMRGIDLLLDRPGTDPRRMILLGAVAGGGDPCAVTAALDRRIAAAVPFNFGGPQPETRYPMPADAETWFNYLGGSHWESTRGLRRGGVDGFPHWVIVGGIAPRRLIYAHEFSWDQARDPVWKRLRKIYDQFYKVPGNLAFAHGKGGLKGRPPQASHCTNIGAYHRRMIHPAFKRWFGIDVRPEDEYSMRLPPNRLICLTNRARRQLKPKSLVQLVSELGAARASAARELRMAMPLDQWRQQLQCDFVRLLGNVQPATLAIVKRQRTDEGEKAAVRVERVVLEVEPGIVVPLIFLSPSPRSAERLPVVVALAQAGKQALLRQRAAELSQLLAGGVSICLPDLRGTGETKSGTSRGRASDDGNRSVNILLFGETMLGQRLRDLRGVVNWLRDRDDVAPRKIGLWGDSLAAVNSPSTNFQVPRGVDGRPRQSEPLGGLLALFGTLLDDQIQATYVRGGLTSFHDVLTTSQVLIPHDVVVPGALAAGDLPDVAAALAPRPLRLEQLVDGLNRRAAREEVRATYAPAEKAYRTAGQPQRLSFGATGVSAAPWLLARLGDGP